MLCLLTVTPSSVGCPYLKHILCTHVTWRRRSLLARHPHFSSFCVFLLANSLPGIEYPVKKRSTIVVIVVAAVVDFVVVVAAFVAFIIIININ